MLYVDVLDLTYWSLSSKSAWKVSHTQIRIMEKGLTGQLLSRHLGYGWQSPRLDTQSWLALVTVHFLSLCCQWQGTHSSRLHGHLERASSGSTGPCALDLHWAAFNVCTFAEARVKAAGNILSLRHSDWPVPLFPQGDTKERGALSSSQYISLLFYTSSSFPPWHLGRSFQLFTQYSCTRLWLICILVHCITSLQMHRSLHLCLFFTFSKLQIQHP